MDLLAEREGYQHRIKSLEAQVLNLEQLIEDVEKETSKKDQSLTHTPVSSFFVNAAGPSFSANNSNNGNILSESQSGFLVAENSDEIENSTREPTTTSLFPPEDQVVISYKIYGINNTVINNI